VAYPSLHRMAELAIKETATTPVRLVRYHGFGNGLPEDEPEEVVDDPEASADPEPNLSVTHAERTRPAQDTQTACSAGVGTTDASDVSLTLVTHAFEWAARTDLRRCEVCDRDFVVVKKWQRFCSPACRVRAHRLGAEFADEVQEETRRTRSTRRVRRQKEAAD
jgi:hypothetical protein